MGFQIEDGKGSGRAASVSAVQRLNVSAKTNPRIFYASRDFGLSFHAVSVDTDASAGDLILYVQNTSATALLFVQDIEFHSANATVWVVWVVTGTPAGGSLLTAHNLNLTSGTVSETTVRGNGALTGLTTANRMGTHRVVAGSGAVIDYKDALILGQNDAIAIEYDTGSDGAAEAEIFFHFENIGAT